MFYTERVSKRIGRLILGDTPLSPTMQATEAGQGSAKASAAMEGQQVPQQPAQGSNEFESRMVEGVSVADRPRQQQTGCETCGQSLEPHDARVRCAVCTLWTHRECVETLRIGYSWRAEMCLTCEQRASRKLRVIKAIELRRGNRWVPDDWFRDLLHDVLQGGAYGISGNRDLNELESTFGRALQNQLNCYELRDPLPETEEVRDETEQQAREEGVENVPKTPPGGGCTGPLS